MSLKQGVVSSFQQHISEEDLQNMLASDELVQQIMDLIAASDLPLDDQLFYSMALSQGFFSMELWDLLMASVKPKMDSAPADIEALDQEISELETSIAADEEALATEMALGLGEVKKAYEVMEEDAIEWMEKAKVSDDENKIKNIKKILS